MGNILRGDEGRDSQLASRHITSQENWIKLDLLNLHPIIAHGGRDERSGPWEENISAVDETLCYKC